MPTHFPGGREPGLEELGILGLDEALDVVREPERVSPIRVEPDLSNIRRLLG